MFYDKLKDNHIVGDYVMELYEKTVVSTLDGTPCTLKSLSNNQLKRLSEKNIFFTSLAAKRLLISRNERGIIK